MIFILCLLVFIMCWLAAMINFVIMFITKSKLNKVLKQRLPNIRRNLNMQDAKYSFSHVKTSSKDLVKMFFSFGSKASSTVYFNNFVEVSAIENSNDNEIKRLLSKSIRVYGNLPKFWIVGVSSCLIGMLGSFLET